MKCQSDRRLGLLLYSKLVPSEVRTLILASDDEAWMVSEIEAMRQARPEWKVYFLEAPKPENHDKKSSESAMDL